MKKFWLALLIALLFISGCVKSSPPNPNGLPKADAPPNKVHTATITETNAPKYFIPSTVIPDGSLFGMSGNNLTYWNPRNSELKSTGSAWSGMLSPDATKIAFINEQGLNVLDVNTGSITSVVQNSSQDDSSLALGLWSPNSGEFLYMYVREWSSDYFIYNIETEEKTAYKFQNIPNFLSSPVDWYNDGLLFIVHANRSKSGEQEYRESGYRSDLMLADMDGNCTPLTRLDDGQFALYGGTSSNHQHILVVIWESESKSSAGVLNNSDGIIDYLPGQENTVGGSISPDGQFAILISATSEDGRYNARLFDMTSNTVILQKELAGPEPPRHFMWSKDSCNVSFGILGSDDNSTLYTVNIK
ncbi:hypothetical protein [Desulfoscipio gibsoniae]|uniref:Periplasmic component of the Tol biopolymer transport system n=1 Tax=Desulfoscipio gibsoniae DSM 7213 TaxID=767817 RepID=R4KGL6_9FIRM|nr:hypothetical protein [Desulfoscipio gibsoniae]AGL01744.1 hypothetical protein Desgi_2325 [Desulfoscipio gibsoniae DSM 7213]